MALLKINGLTKYFGGLAAVSDLDLEIFQGEVMGLIGPNGAGKTTVFNLITGLLRPTRGRIIFNGIDITGKKPHVIARLGIARTFQLTQYFPDFTVVENLLGASYIQIGAKILDMYIGTESYRQKEKEALDGAEKILNAMGLSGLRDVKAKNLPHGFQKLLGVAMALATKPKLLLLDEPLGGLAPSDVGLILEAIQMIRNEGTTIMVIEHNMQILEVCTKVVVMNYGKKIAEGLPEEVTTKKEVVEAYFGEQHVA